jgi:hypothetical protein
MKSVGAFDQGVELTSRSGSDGKLRKSVLLGFGDFVVLDGLSGSGMDAEASTFTELTLRTS